MDQTQAAAIAQSLARIAAALENIDRSLKAQAASRPTGILPPQPGRNQ